MVEALRKTMITAFTTNLKGKVLDGRGWSDWIWDSNISTKVIPRGSLNNNGDIDEGYTVEVAIPWSRLGVVPIVGHSIGLQIGVTDRDVGGEYEYFGWPISNETFNNPNRWSKVELRGSVQFSWDPSMG